MKRIYEAEADYLRLLRFVLSLDLSLSELDQFFEITGYTMKDYKEIKKIMGVENNES